MMILAMNYCLTEIRGPIECIRSHWCFSEEPFLKQFEEQYAAHVEEQILGNTLQWFMDANHRFCENDFLAMPTTIGISNSILKKEEHLCVS